MNRYQKALNEIKNYKANSHRLGECKPLRSQLEAMQELVDLQPTGSTEGLIETIKGISDRLDILRCQLPEGTMYQEDICCFKEAAKAMRNAITYMNLLYPETAEWLDQKLKEDE